MRVARPVRAAELYYESLKVLGNSPETLRAGLALYSRVINSPETGTLLPGGQIRVAQGYLYRDFTPMRLFYWIDDDGGINLLYIERFEPRPQ